MRERPILFSAPMVRAILAGTKVQTRRVMVPQPAHLQRHEWRGKLVYEGEHRLWCWRGHTFENLWDEYIREPDRLELSCMSPYGVVGDRLWLKETIRRVNGRAVFAADGAPTVIDTWPWKRDVLTAIHTPRGASRITLEVTEVRVQRLQEISEDDARAEGVTGPHYGRWTDSEGGLVPPASEPARPWAHSFAVAWQAINGKRAPWSSNPWVWAISFRRLP